MFIHDVMDRNAITDLTFAYAFALDTQDWEALGACFTEDGVLRLGVVRRDFHGRTAIEAGFREMTPPELRKLHQTSNHQYLVKGDLASGTCLFTAYQWTGEGETSQNLRLHAGRYRDELVRTEAGWLIKDRTIDLQLRHGFQRP